MAKDIRTRCKLIRGLRKYRIPYKTYQQICQGFIGGKLNYYLPWLAAEIGTNMRKTLKPIEIAYRDYMRTYTGCFPSTPIPLLHAISGFPLLKDKIITETTMTVLAAQANGTILGREYTAWNGEGDGWTPLGEVWKALKERIPESYEAVHARVNISAQTLEGLYKVRYHKSNRQQAIKKHRKGKLLPVKPDVEIWTDGSYNLNNGGGAAALLIDHKRNAEDKTPDEVEIGSKLGQSVTSSYECEIIALNIGLEVAIERLFKIGIFTL